MANVPAQIVPENTGACIVLHRLAGRPGLVQTSISRQAQVQHGLTSFQVRVILLFSYLGNKITRLTDRQRATHFVPAPSCVAFGNSGAECCFVGVGDCCSIHYRPSDHDWIGRHHGTSRYHTTACDDAWPGIVDPARCGPARGPSGDGARPRNFVGAFVQSNAGRAATPRDLAHGITIVGTTLDRSDGGAVHCAAQHHRV